MIITKESKMTASFYLWQAVRLQENGVAWKLEAVLRGGSYALGERTV